MQDEVADKANEIRAAPRLLEAIDRHACVVTGDVPEAHRFFALR